MIYVGLVVAFLGFVIAMVNMFASDKVVKKSEPIFAALHMQGPQAARALVDRLYPASANVTLVTYHRMAALGLLGEAEAIERELPAHTGKPQFVAMANAIGLLGIVLHSKTETAAARLEDVAESFAKDAPRLMSIAVANLRAVAGVGGAVVRGDLSRLDRPQLLKVVIGQPLTKMLVWEAMAKAFERAGELDKAKNTREEVKRFEAMRRPRVA